MSARDTIEWQIANRQGIRDRAQAAINAGGYGDAQIAEYRKLVAQMDRQIGQLQQQLPAQGGA